MFGCLDDWMFGCLDVWMFGCLDQYNELHAFLKLNFSQNLLPFECHSAFQPALQDITKSELDGELENELEVWLEGRLKGPDGGRLF